MFDPILYKFTGIFEDECKLFDKATNKTIVDKSISDVAGEKTQYLYFDYSNCGSYEIASSKDLTLRYTDDEIKTYTKDLSMSKKRVTI